MSSVALPAQDPSVHSLPSSLGTQNVTVYTRHKLAVGELDSSFKKPQSLGMTIHFLETVADEFKESDLAARIPAGHRFEESTAQESRRSSRVTFKEGDKPELTGCPIRPTILA
jgi:hypothetical protein